jgi:hypothetical protein
MKSENKALNAMYKMTKEWMERAALWGVGWGGDRGRVIEFCGTSHVELIRIYDLPEIQAASVACVGLLIGGKL